jgi:hypothetical protein
MFSGRQPRQGAKVLQRFRELLRPHFQGASGGMAKPKLRFCMSDREDLFELCRLDIFKTYSFKISSWTLFSGSCQRLVKHSKISFALPLLFFGPIFIVSRKFLTLLWENIIFTLALETTFSVNVIIMYCGSI